MIKSLLYCCLILMLLSVSSKEEQLVGYWQIKKMERKNNNERRKAIELPVFLFQFGEDGTFRAGMRGTKDFSTGTWKLSEDNSTVSIAGMAGEKTEAMKILKLTGNRLVLEDKRSKIYLKKL